jgi:hypothetical protein
MTTTGFARRSLKPAYQSRQGHAKLRKIMAASSVALGLIAGAAGVALAGTPSGGGRGAHCDQLAQKAASGDGAVADVLLRVDQHAYSGSRDDLFVAPVGSDAAIVGSRRFT